MRLKNIVRSAVTGGAALALALGLSSCSRDYTVAYVYAVSGNAGTIAAYAVDYETGILHQISGSPFTSPFTNPIKIVAAPNSQFVYVIGGSQDAQVEEYAVGTDGKLYGQHGYNLTGTYPTSATVDTTGTFLYVTYQYQMGYSNASPGPGGVTIFPINADNSLGTAVNFNLGNDPVGIALSTPVCVATPIIAAPASTACTGVTGGSNGFNNVYAYVLDQGTQNLLATTTPTVIAFAQNMSTGALTPLSGTNATTFQGVNAGVTPTAIAVDGTTRFVYVTDENQNEIFGYGIARNTTGALTPLTGSPFGTGQFPVSLTIDPSAKFLYTANFNSGSVSQFTINQANGNLSTIVGSTFSTAAGTNCVSVDPALGQFVFASNYTDNSISAGELNTTTGAVTAVVDTPFPTVALPTCLVSVAAGPHATSVLQP